MKRVKYHEAKFLSERLDNLNAHAKDAFKLQQIGSIVAFIAVIGGIFMTYIGRIEIAIIQAVSTIAVSLVTYLFYKQSNKANDDTNKFALISIKFNESWNIVEEAMDHCSFITDENQRYETVKKIIDKQLELALSDRLWTLTLDLQKTSSGEVQEDKASNVS